MFSKKKPAPVETPPPPPPPPLVEEEKPPVYVVLISVEKDLSIGPKKTATVPLIIPALPDLEFSWEVTVRGKNVGVSAQFLEDDAPLGADGESPKQRYVSQRSMGPMQSTVEPSSPGSARAASAPKARPPGSRNKWPRAPRPFRKKGSSDQPGDHEDGDAEFEDQSTSSRYSTQTAGGGRSFEAGPLGSPSGRGESRESLVSYERCSPRNVIEGTHRFKNKHEDGKPFGGGRVVFFLDNSYSKARRKRVKVKLLVESINPEAEQQVVEAEQGVLVDLKNAVLAIVSDPDGYLDNELNLKRFLDARPTFDESVAMLSNTLKWRNEGHYFRPGGCPACLDMPGKHLFRQIGFDKERRPVIFISLTQVINKIRLSYSPFEALTHLVNVFEQGHKTMEPGAAVGFTWIADLQGMTWADCRQVARLTGELEEGNVKDEASGKKETFISVLADHYPQTLGSCVMLRPPVFLFSIFNVVKSFMDPKTAKAYYFVRSEKAIERALDDLFDKEVGEWIRTEFGLINQETNSQAEARGKVFRGPNFWEPAPLLRHDPRGTEEYVRRFCAPDDQRQVDQSKGWKDPYHRAHPNICHFIETGDSGGTPGAGGGGGAANGSSSSPAGLSLDAPLSGGGGGGVAAVEDPPKLTPRQEREEAKKIIKLTMAKIKESMASSEVRGFQAAAGARNGGGESVEKKRKGGGGDGAQMTVGDRLSKVEAQMVESLDQPESKDKSLDQVLDEILAKEFKGSGQGHLLDEEDLVGSSGTDEGSEEGSEDDGLSSDDDQEDFDDDGGIAGLNISAHSSKANGAKASKGGGSGGGGRSASGGLRRVVVPARGQHTERIDMSPAGCKAGAKRVSWAFQVDTGDVGFVAAFIPEGSVRPTPVQPFTRCRNRRLHEGSYEASSGGALTLRWDNSYSRLRNKGIVLDIKKG